VPVPPPKESYQMYNRFALITRALILNWNGRDGLIYIEEDEIAKAYSVKYKSCYNLSFGLNWASSILNLSIYNNSCSSLA
jgi:hypothetical protein